MEIIKIFILLTFASLASNANAEDSNIDPRAAPVYGVDGGIGIGILPDKGPPGLLQVYAPYLEQNRVRVINYIAIEPIVGVARGFSELEKLNIKVVKSERTTNGVHIQVTTDIFANGALPIVDIYLDNSAPYEVRFNVSADVKSANLEALILTATMGNYAALRQIWHGGGEGHPDADRKLHAREIWSDLPENAEYLAGFADVVPIPFSYLYERDGYSWLIAESDEAGPGRGDEIPRGWRYSGKEATQYWRAKTNFWLHGRINARNNYWGTNVMIPGGLSIENLELYSPYVKDQEFIFGVSLKTMDELVKP